jgi:hypothetical protein
MKLKTIMKAIGGEWDVEEVLRIWGRPFLPNTETEDLVYDGMVIDCGTWEIRSEETGEVIGRVNEETNLPAFWGMMVVYLVAEKKAIGWRIIEIPNEKDPPPYVFYTEPNPHSLFYYGYAAIGENREIIKEVKRNEWWEKEEELRQKYIKGG